MNSFRKNNFSKVVALVTGLLFLNMSFLLTEIALLKVSDRQILENVARLISSGGFEEERDGDTQAEKDASIEDFIIPHSSIREQLKFSLLSKEILCPEDLYPHANYSQTFSPPPDSFQSL
jgi:hypothetical protein